MPSQRRQEDAGKTSRLNKPESGFRIVVDEPGFVNQPQGKS
jgi:hypothetical protein